MDAINVICYFFQLSSLVEDLGLPLCELFVDFFLEKLSSSKLHVTGLHQQIWMNLLFYEQCLKLLHKNLLLLAIKLKASKSTNTVKDIIMVTFQLSWRRKTSLFLAQAGAWVKNPKSLAGFEPSAVRGKWF